MERLEIFYNFFSARSHDYANYIIIISIKINTPHPPPSPGGSILTFWGYLDTLADTLG